MLCPLKFNHEFYIEAPFDSNSLKCNESNCAWWIGGEQQECAIKNLSFHLRKINEEKCYNKAN